MYDPHKYHYDALFADRRYRETLRDSRSGISLSKKELRRIDAVVSPLIWQGHSSYQNVVEHPELGLSVRSIYQYIELSLLTSNIDPKRKVKFKARKCHKTQITNREVFHDRLYSDFQQLPPTHVVEMDTVRSSRNVHADFIFANLQIIFYPPPPLQPSPNPPKKRKEDTPCCHLLHSLPTTSLFPALSEKKSIQRKEKERRGQLLPYDTFGHPLPLFSSLSTSLLRKIPGIPVFTRIERDWKGERKEEGSSFPVSSSSLLFLIIFSKEKGEKASVYRG